MSAESVPEAQPTASESPDLDEPREIKVKLPIEIHIKLQSLKITRGRPIGAVVLEALDAFFRRFEKGRDGKL